MLAKIINKHIKPIVILLPVVLGVLVFLVKDYIFKFAGSMPGCSFYTLTGKACPGCGGTRSVKALLDGDILLSLRYNAIVIFLVVIAVLFYIEWITHVFFRHKVLVPRSIVFLCTMIGIFASYFIIRNFIPALSL